MAPFQYLQRMGIDVWVSRTAPASLEQVGSPFYFLLLNYQEIGICCSLSPQEPTVPPDVRRFCDDVAYALSRSKVLPAIGDLRWPLADSVGENAQDVVRQLVQALPETVIVFGEKFANHVLDVEDVLSGNIHLQGAQRVFVVDDVSEYIGNSNAKKSLWINMEKVALIDGNSRA